MKAITKEERKKIVEAIGKAEKATSGEIRVHIDRNCKGDVLTQSAWWFHKLKMDQTQARNGVLVYVATESKKFAIIGDAGIDAKVPENFWEETKQKMTEYFKQGNLADGIIYGVLEAGRLLASYFPCQSDDVNELSNEISFGGQ